jgi:hypothetical protein
MVMNSKSASVFKDPDVDETQSTIDDNYVVVLPTLTIIMLLLQIRPFTTSFLSAKSKTFIAERYN